jgi:hypothetical protein
MARKSGIEIVPAAFTDHHAVALRFTIPIYDMGRRRGRWKVNPMLMQDESIKGKIRTAWVKWRFHKRYYPDVVMWWERCEKKQLQRLIRQEESERHSKHRLG